jgi:hypothetical protein
MTVAPSDWSNSYSQYLARSAAISSRTLHLYQLVMERISQGKLPATIFQDHFPTFAGIHGQEFANRFADIGSRFLTDLVRLGTQFSPRDSATHTTGADQEIAPPQFDPANQGRWCEQLAEYAGQLNARALKAYRTQLDRVAAGQTTPSEVQQQTSNQMAEQLPGYMQMMTQLYFDLLNGLNDVRSDYEETYFRGLLVAAEDADEGSAITLTLAGPSGGTAAAGLSVTNTTGHRAQIGHQIIDVRRVDGAGPSLIPAIVFAPEKLELDPDEEGTITISLQLDPERYDTDVLYSGPLYLTGGSNVPLEVELRILATTATPNQHKR